MLTRFGGLKSPGSAAPFGAMSKNMRLFQILVPGF